MSPILLVSLIGTFISVALASGAIAYSVLERQSPGLRRLQGTAPDRRAAAKPASTGALADQPTRTTERIASLVPKSPREMNKLRRRLVRA